MQLTDLKPSNIYYLPGLGNVIYAGLSESKQIMLRPIEHPDYISYLDSRHVDTIRMPLDKNSEKKLQAEYLHDEMLLHVGDSMFFENSSGIVFGKIKYLYNNSCDFVAKGMTNRIHLRHLFTYETIIGNLQERRCIKDIMQGKDSPDTFREVSEQATH